MSKTIEQKSVGQYDMLHNVEYVVKGADGKVKPIFQQNELYTLAMKKGILSPFAYQKFGGIFAPVLGHWSGSAKVKNLITNAGFGGISSRVNGAGAQAAFTYIAVGTGVVAANVTDTTLGTETAASGLSRAAATCTQVTTTVTNDTAQQVVTFTVTGTVAVTESGVLNAASAGTLLCRQVFSAINVVSGDSLQITWKVKAS